MPRSTVQRAIARAEALLPGTPASEGARDPRWQAIIRVGEFIPSEPGEVWTFTIKWAKHPQQDLRAAITTCLIEHLLEVHFDSLFPRLRTESLRSIRFARCVTSCWSFGQAEEAMNASRMRRLVRELHDRFGSSLYESGP